MSADVERNAVCGPGCGAMICCSTSIVREMDHHFRLCLCMQVKMFVWHSLVLVSLLDSFTLDVDGIGCNQNSSCRDSHLRAIVTTNNQCHLVDDQFSHIVGDWVLIPDCRTNERKISGTSQVNRRDCGLNISC